MELNWSNALRRGGRLWPAPLVVAALLSGIPLSFAVEGTTAAGPVGGTDMRVVAANAVRSQAVTVGFIKKFN